MTHNWRFQNNPETSDDYQIIDADSDSGDVVAIVPKTGNEQFDELTVYSRVALMTAAPALLAFAERVRVWLVSPALDADTLRQFAAEATAAIKQATGA